MTNCHKTDNVESALNYPPKFTHLHFPLFYVLWKLHLKVEAIASEHHYWNKHNGNSKKVLPVSKRVFYEFRKIMGCVGMWIPVEKWKMIQRCAISDFMSGLPLHRSPQRKKDQCVWVFWAGVWVKRQKDPHIMKLSEITSHFTQQQLLRRGKKVLVMNFITMK